MTKIYKTDPNPPSEMFMKSLTNGYGSTDMICGWCDRQHLCPETTHYDDDHESSESYKNYCELEKKNNSDGVVLNYDCDSVLGHYVNGVLFVDECPCNGLYRFEQFIWKDRELIRNYLRDRIQQEWDFIKQEQALNILKGIHDKDPTRGW